MLVLKVVACRADMKELFVRVHGTEDVSVPVLAGRRVGQLVGVGDVREVRMRPRHERLDKCEDGLGIV